MLCRSSCFCEKLSAKNVKNDILVAIHAIWVPSTALTIFGPACLQRQEYLKDLFERMMSQTTPVLGPLICKDGDTSTSDRDIMHTRTLLGKDRDNWLSTQLDQMPMQQNWLLIDGTASSKTD